jgi:phage baseplate assembly protein gpV
VRNFNFFVILFCIILTTTYIPVSYGSASTDQIGTFNISELSAQVIATAEESRQNMQKSIFKEEKSDITETPAYRLFTLNRDYTRYQNGTAIEYEGSTMGLYSIEIDTTCYFCIPKSQWPTSDIYTYSEL